VSRDHLSKQDAVKALRHCLEDGDVVPTKHFRDELEAEELTMADALYVLRKGNVYNEPELDVRLQEWNYRIEGTDGEGRRLAIVFSVPEDDLGRLITIFSIRTS
jgi:Domain of unknown function (DUF4258)